MATKQALKVFKYRGPVMHYGKIVDNCYTAETQAVSSIKALSNLSYRWKHENDRGRSYKVELDINCLKSVF